MTAEIGILNKQGVVIAADSAVTVGGQKVYNTSNKMFTLGKKHFVGLMTFGNAEFMSVPWQIIFKRFGKSIGSERLEHMEDYANRLVDFVREDPELHEPVSMKLYIKRYSFEMCKIVYGELKRQIAPGCSEEEVVKLIQKIIVDALDAVKSQEQLTIDYTYTEFSESYNTEIKNTLSSFSVNEPIGMIFSKNILTSDIFEALKNLIYCFVTQGKDVLSYSGIVVAGYGEEDIFPRLYAFNFYGNVDAHLVFRPNSDVEIGQTNVLPHSTAAIMPFAQQDVAATILNGIAPDFSDKLSDVLKHSTLSDKESNAIMKDISEYQRNNFIAPMLDSVATLSVSELAEVAETLVNLTEFKRKYTSTLATVGGPIDVLAITYNEGPVWIKQKHYFNLEDNLDYKLRRQWL